jgi:hypothetical protein
MAMPLLPRSFAQVTCVTATLSEAGPGIAIVGAVVLNVAAVVGAVWAIVGFVLSGGV